MTGKPANLWPAGLAILAGLVLAVVSAAAVGAEDAEIRLNLGTRIIGQSQASEQSPSQVLESLEKPPPELVDLPLDLSSDARYFLIRIGEEDRPMVVDIRQHRRANVLVLYVDTRGDGRLSNERPLNAISMRPGMFGRDTVRFGPAVVNLDRHYGENRVSFHVTTTDGDVLNIYPFQCRQGTVEIDTTTYTISIIDGNLDGRYDIREFRTAVNVAGLDSISVLRHENLPPDQRYSGLLPLTRVLRLGDDYYDIELDSAGESMTLRRTQMDHGTLEIKNASVRLQLWSNLAGQMVTGSGEWRLPTAQYRVLSMELIKKDHSGGIWTLREFGSPRNLKNFRIGKDQTTALSISDEIQIKTFGAARNRLYTVGFDFACSEGFRYRAAIYRNGIRQQEPAIRIICESGRVLTVGRFKYG